MATRCVLHLVGSPTNDFYRELSELYARGCIDALRDPRRYEFLVAHVSPDGRWRFPASLEPRAIEDAKALPISDAIGWINQQSIDAALPQMFCLPGMTDMRALLELLGLPYLGNRPLQMALTADKAKAKAIVAAAGVRVPSAELLEEGAATAFLRPVVVKPNDSDNSDGVTLVSVAEDYPDALRVAFAHSHQVLVEDYIAPGREVRCGVIERDGELICLPLQEYFLDRDTRPIRSKQHKLGRDQAQQLSLTSKTAAESWSVDGDDPIVALVHDAARRCHAALGCRQYSLFDFRIDPLGRPWFLEAGLYCSFSPQSVLVTMAEAAGLSLRQFFDESIENLSASVSA